VAASPVWVAGELVAVLVVGGREPRALAAHEVESLELLAAQAGAALNTAGRFAERRSFEEQLIHQAFHDPLTALPNRARFCELLEASLAREDGSHEHVGVLFVDLDGFKSVNDSLGHDAGDQLLVAVAARLQAAIRPSDTVARLGGDEFTVLLDGVVGVEDAAVVARRVVEHLGDPFLLLGRRVVAAASVGVAVGRRRATKPDELLRAADLAMYHAKERGKGGYEIFEERLATRAV
jgi:diguanylate cyclase (GGDEF)-like protein